ncbi:hypothetical protein K503DRAFT_468531 [Rhizopogon vinicolor AM-OR11-026]|uniref:Uncharacterized protein n=1 Tax=Rhizopogon vinicolor AM-OR11-026 TaxID=1314800 RepID=A0A1B7MNG3_9AGAM|nr:hypothetical protein K503DRAFT_468531 [Rhizopogon vinicolor AM-OR11-026]
MSPISSQPITSTMDVYGPSTTDEKRSRPCQHDDHNMNFPCECPSSSHRACHKARLRRVILPIALLLLSLGALLVMSYCSEVSDLLDVLGLGNGHGISLGKRQSTTSSTSSFTSKKLYLIIVFVGLFLVLIAAIMLSFWCCKGSFENPLCCPCYLCACCGGLGKQGYISSVAILTHVNSMFGVHRLWPLRSGP